MVMEKSWKNCCQVCGIPERGMAGGGGGGGAVQGTGTGGQAHLSFEVNAGFQNPISFSIMLNYIWTCYLGLSSSLMKNGM